MIKFSCPSREIFHSGDVNRFFRTAAIFCLFVSLFVAPLQAGAITVDQSKPASRSVSWEQMTGVEKVQFSCALTAVVMFFVAEIWFIVAGFQASVGWGLFMLFIGGTRSIFAALVMILWLVHWQAITGDMPPFAAAKMVLVGYVVFAGTGAIIFFTRHWEHARRPFSVMAFGIVLILAVVGLQMVR